MTAVGPQDPIARGASAGDVPVRRSVVGGGLRERSVEVHRCADASEVASLAADRIEAVLASEPHPVIGVATGSTPTATYAELVRRHVDVRHCDVFLLDEYLGLGPGAADSYRSAIRAVWCDELGLPVERVHGPDGSATEPEAEARRYEAAIAAAGGISLQLLGIGRNGHIGFNEPGSPFNGRTSVVDLAEATRADNARFFDEPAAVPRRAITQGIGTILGARRLLVLATGDTKAAALRAAVEDDVSPVTPASAIRLHPAATVIADRQAARLLR